MISFTCNICGTPIAIDEVPWEQPTCTGCGSNVRMRALIYLLSLELFGAARFLRDFPQNKQVRGFGLSDALLYATPLAEKVDYTNTFYDRQPYLDITQEHPDQYGTYDFILSSDVFEHVAPPIDRALEEAFRLLKPNGFLCITVPSTHVTDETVEYYPDLHQYSIVELGGEHVLINRKKDKTLEIRENLEFHGGIGMTLVMRLFAISDLERRLRAAGFAEVFVQSDPVAQYGIYFPGPWSLPLVARKEPFPKLPVANPATEQEPVPKAEKQFASNSDLDTRIAHLHAEKAALECRVSTLENQMRLAAGSRWLRLGRALGLGPRLD